MKDVHRKGRILAKGTLSFSLVLISLFSLGACYSFAADTVPDLKGSWQGKTQTVAVGKLGHVEHSTQPKFISAEFTIHIDKQEGMLFYGVKKSKKTKEQILGLVKPDGKSIYMADHDGYYEGTLLSPDQMEVVYLEAGTGSRVASYTVYKRVK